MVVGADCGQLGADPHLVEPRTHSGASQLVGRGEVTAGQRPGVPQPVACVGTPDVLLDSPELRCALVEAGTVRVDAQDEWSWTVAEPPVEPREELELLLVDDCARPDMDRRDVTGGAIGE